MGVIAGFFRACATAVLFALFALGGAVITVFIMPFVPNRRAGQRVVRLVWIVLVKIFTALRSFRSTHRGCARSRGELSSPIILRSSMWCCLPPRCPGCSAWRKVC